MAEKPQGRNRKRKHFEMEKHRQSPFQNPKNAGVPAGIVSKAPRGINAAEFAESRALEIHNMMQALSSASKQSNKRVFQSLPRHMRRRAASHNPKRMPVRLRDAYNREALKTQSEKPKEPSKQKKSRRHRRKHSNLLAEYTRRQRKHAWLETHIWHAKRFKVVEQWGYKIPLHPSDKSVKASCRAMANSCLLQDISYFQCIEIHGRQEMIVAAMKHLTSCDIGPTMAAKEYLDGRHEGHTILYKYNQCPNQAIEPVMFLWQQHLQEDKTITNSMRKLWVWSHPICSNEVVNEIVHACSLEGPTDYEESKSWLSKENEMTENTATSGISGSKLNVTVLHEELVRLRLTGPKSHALLLSTLELFDWSAEKGHAGSRWWEVYSKGEDRMKMLEEQNKSWEQMKGVGSPGVLKAGSVIALVVKDPRLGLPVRKSSLDMASEDICKDVSGDESTLTSIFESSVASPLWDSAVRKEVKQTKMPEKELNNLRSKQDVPGSSLDLGDETSRIPILVVQQPGSAGYYQVGSINFGCGYDVILPAGWSMAFWIAFVYRGARVGGARELATCSREQGMPHFPCDFPDTKAGFEYNEKQKSLGQDKYKRYPPAKRPNYLKFGIASPYGPDWNTLVNEWGSQVDRLKDDMRKIVDNEKAIQDSQPGKIHHLVPESDERKVLVNGHATELSVKDHESDVNNRCLKDNGVQSVDNAKAPSNDNEDSKKVCEHVGDSVSNKDIAGDSETTFSTNPQYNVIRKLSTLKQLQNITLSLKQFTKKRPQKHKIPNKDIIEYLTKTITTCSRSLICLNLRPLLKGCPEDNAIICIPTPQDLMELQKDKSYGGPVEHVHKCNNTSTVIGQCSRKAIGWVTSGQYSFARGQGSGIGFCTFPGFCELTMRTLQEKCSPVVLVRNTSTFQYRFANIIVV